MGLEIGTNPMDMDAIAARLAADFAAVLTDVRVQEPDTVVARCDRAALKDVAQVPAVLAGCTSTWAQYTIKAVSYTHLTLPTIYSV